VSGPPGCGFRPSPSPLWRPPPFVPHYPCSQPEHPSHRDPERKRDDAQAALERSRELAPLTAQRRLDVRRQLLRRRRVERPRRVGYAHRSCHLPAARLYRGRRSPADSGGPPRFTPRSIALHHSSPRRRRGLSRGPRPPGRGAGRSGSRLWPASRRPRSRNAGAASSHRRSGRPRTRTRPRRAIARF
jgi:hypothetical protein